MISQCVWPYQPTASAIEVEERRDILAFRLITKTLGRMEPSIDSPFTMIDSLESFQSRWTSTDDRQEVKISDAFAHLAVAEHYVVAIATNRKSVQLAAQEAAKQDKAKQSSPLNILACASLLPVETPKKPTKTGPDGLLWYFSPIVDAIQERIQDWKVVVAKNPLVTDPKCLAPTIIESAEPDDFKQCGNLKSYIKSLMEKW